MIIKGSSGMGDSIYVYPVVKHYMKQGHDVTVQTQYPEVFGALDCKVMPYLDHATTGHDIYCAYSQLHLKENKAYNQYQDTLHLAGIAEELPLRMEFLKRSAIDVKLQGKKLCVIKQPSNSRSKAHDIIAPDVDIFQKIIDTFHNQYYFVQVGLSWEGLHILKNIDLDLTDKTNVWDLLWLVYQSDMVITQSGFLVPMAEALGRRAFCILSKKGLNCDMPFFASITEEKIKCSDRTKVVIDDDYMALQTFDRFRKHVKPEKWSCIVKNQKSYDMYFGKKLVLHCPTGLGDYIYLYCIANHLIEQGYKIKVVSAYKELFALGGIEALDAYQPDPQWKLKECNYFYNKHDQTQDQFVDMCSSIGIKERVKYEIELPKDGSIFKIKTKKRICIIKHPFYKVQNHASHYRIISDTKPFEDIIKEFKDEFFFVQVGVAGIDNYLLEGVDYDLIGRTNVVDLLHLVNQADLVITRPGHLLPMAEALNTKCLCIAARKMLDCEDDFITTITSEKILCKPEFSAYVVDDDPDIIDKLHGLLQRRVYGKLCYKPGHVQAQSKRKKRSKRRRSKKVLPDSEAVLQR